MGLWRFFSSEAAEKAEANSSNLWIISNSKKFEQLCWNKNPLWSLSMSMESFVVDHKQDAARVVQDVDVCTVVLALKISEIAGTPVSAEGLEFIAAEEVAWRIITMVNLVPLILQAVKTAKVSAEMKGPSNGTAMGLNYLGLWNTQIRKSQEKICLLCQ